MDRTVYFLLANGPRELKSFTIHIAEIYSQQADLHTFHLVFFTCNLVVTSLLIIAGVVYFFFKMRQFELHKAIILSLYSFLTLQDISQVHQKSAKYLNELKGSQNAKIDQMNQGNQPSVRNSTFIRSIPLEKQNQRYSVDRSQDKAAIQHKHHNPREEEKIEEKAQGIQNASYKNKYYSSNQKYSNYMNRIITSIKEVQEIESKMQEQSMKVNRMKKFKQLEEIKSANDKEPSTQEKKNTNRNLNRKVLDQDLNSDQKLQESRSQSEDEEYSSQIDQRNQLTKSQKTLRDQQFQHQIRNSFINFFIITLCVGILIMTYFVQSFSNNYLILQNTVSSIEQFEYFVDRQTSLTQAFYYLREQIVNNNKIVFDNIEDLLVQIEQSQESMITVQKMASSKEYIFTTTKEYVMDLDNDDYCQAIIKDLPMTTSNDESNRTMSEKINVQILNSCALFEDGLYEQGYQYIMGVFTKQFTDMYFKLSSDEADRYLAEYQEELKTNENGSIFHTFLFTFEQFIIKTTKTMKYHLKHCFEESENHFLFIYRFLFAIFIFFLAIVLFLLRPRLLKTLCDKIFQNRGIMNLIPEELFEENKDKFEEILKELKD